MKKIKVWFENCKWETGRWLCSSVVTRLGYASIEFDLRLCVYNFDKSNMIKEECQYIPYEEIPEIMFNKEWQHLFVRLYGM